MDWETLRKRMVEEQIKRRGIRDKRVIDAFLKVPRHEFVPPESKVEAYNDYPLPIGGGQTISQPYMVALMTELLRLKGNEKVLEIGTGSGYQTAILAELAGEVYTVERIESLLQRAKEILDRLGFKNIFYRVGDGTEGWREYSPFDGIIVTAASPKVSAPLLEQLREGGRLVIPVGERYSQDLVRITKKGERFKEENFGPCVFVPLIGEFGWKND
ncbi:MAG: protein-L-isoaspartate(D-aspartate) O-methyltransferase [Caldiserica bacterium]|nr:protein-L-isoaspartate(D-aspartate) O-methyltransferase [Caldisericota bacterium]